ncbi:MAG: hypothetical protein D6711_14135 [Chloroflexi bacterium]|nr:MAG: hypothetical protein D6711_14135 [Chloroflexota bacterium]
MNVSEAIIERIRQINAGYQHLELAVDEPLQKIKPGQTLLVRQTESWHPYLREHWWTVGVREKRLIVERPLDEHYTPSQVINVLGIVGQPYRFRRSLRNVMLIAHDTAPTPLMMNIPWLLGNNISVTLVLTGEGTRYPTTHLDERVEIIHGEPDFTWQDQVMTIGWADQIFVVVNPYDEISHFKEIVERITDLRTIIPKNYLFGVFRPEFACGAGACNACMIRTQQGTSLVCMEGPAYDLTQLIL